MHSTLSLVCTASQTHYTLCPCTETHTLPRRSVLDSYSLCIRTHVLACQQVKQTHTHTHARPCSTPLIACRSPLQTPCHRVSCVVLLVLLSTGFPPLSLLCTSTAPTPLPLFLPSGPLYYVLRPYSWPALPSHARTHAFSPSKHTSTEMCRYRQAQPRYWLFTQIQISPLARTPHGRRTVHR